MTRKKTNTPRSLRKKESWRDIYTLLKLKKKDRTKDEQKRVETFLTMRRKLNKLFTNKCKICGIKVPRPLEFCSCEHRVRYEQKADEKKNQGTAERTK